MERTKIINDLIAANGYKSYLEIGIGEGSNFRGVNCEAKHAIDPEVKASEFIFMRTGGNFGQMTSDDFFALNEERYDLIFIDGLHHSDQVDKDIANAYACLNKGGMILVHDCMPWEEIITHVPRETVVWTGDVYRSICGFIEKFGAKIKHGYIPERAGLFWIKKTGNYRVVGDFRIVDLPYDQFDKEWKSKILAL